MGFFELLGMLFTIYAAIGIVLMLICLISQPDLVEAEIKTTGELIAVLVLGIFLWPFALYEALTK